MNPIDSVFEKLRKENKKAFIPFVTAGDPDLETTGRLIQELANRGANIIEVGFPYSDPIADGSVIQASYTRALNGGIHLEAIFEAVNQWTQTLDVPLVGMVSYTLVHRRSPDKFLGSATAAGFAGAIIPDLPFEESTALRELCQKRDFKLIQLVTPTTAQQRATQIAQASTGFLYCVSVAGITGERDRLPPELLEQLAWLRTQTNLPLCVGFGVSQPDHVRMLRGDADGVIVGSAIVRRLEDTSRSSEEIIAEVGNYVATLVEALNG
ncbi:MAG: tryptophan synthase subunit alpha [Gemmataceae bacterium]